MSDEETKVVENKVEEPAVEEKQVEDVKFIPTKEEHESPKKITVAPKKKEKDPKKVAQGKRLAQISERAKKEKMRREIEEENQIDFSVNYHTLLYFGLVPLVAFSGFYLYNAQKKSAKTSPEKTKNASPQKPKPEKSSKLVSLFD